MAVGNASDRLLMRLRTLYTGPDHGLWREIEDVGIQACSQHRRPCLGTAISGTARDRRRCRPTAKCTDTHTLSKWSSCHPRIPREKGGADLSIVALSVLVVTAAFIAVVTVAVQSALHHRRSRSGSVAGTRAGRITYLLAGGVNLAAGIVVAIWYADSNPHMLFVAPLAALPFIGLAASLIWDVVQAHQAGRRRNTSRSPPDTPSRQ